MTNRQATQARESLTHALTTMRDLPSARAILLAMLFAVAVVSPFKAHAQDHDHDRPGHNPPAHTHMDGRFAHNQYYFDRGYTMHGAPRGGYEVHRGGGNYWYDRGQWYRRQGGLSIVIGAPLGAFVPILPPYYSTVWWSGVPYYYANDTYYAWNANQDGYEVVDPPAGIESGGTTQAPASDTIFVYPKNGQSAEQQTRDRYECHRSAVDQTGFDPTAAGGGVPPASAASKRSDYLRAQAACLDARGYSVK